jgi:hypothetical protein
MEAVVDGKKLLMTKNGYTAAIDEKGFVVIVDDKGQKLSEFFEDGCTNQRDVVNLYSKEGWKIIDGQHPQNKN